MGGAGDPFRDKEGKIITNRKAAVTYNQDRPQQMSINYNSSYSPLKDNNTLTRITKEEPYLVDQRRQVQAQYQDELKRQIEERNYIKKQEQEVQSSPFYKSQKAQQQNYNYSPYKYQQKQQVEHVPFHNPANLLMFSKVKTFIDGELNTLRNQAKNQQRLASFQLQQMQMDASRIRYENHDFMNSFNNYNDIKRANYMEQMIAQLQNQDDSKSVFSQNSQRRSLIDVGKQITTQNKSLLSSYKSASPYFENFEPMKHISTNSTYLPVSNKLPELSSISEDKQSNLQQLQTDSQFMDLLEIEKINQKTEEDMMVYQFQTEKRQNIEKFLKDIEFSEQFPELKARVESERKQLIANVELKDDLKHTMFGRINQSSIVSDLIEQSAVHNELDKIRRDLNDYTYRSKDPSYLFTDQNSIIFKDSQIIHSEAEMIKKSNAQTYDQLEKWRDNYQKYEGQDHIVFDGQEQTHHIELNNKVQREQKLVDELQMQSQVEQQKEIKIFTPDKQANVQNSIEITTQKQIIIAQNAPKQSNENQSTLQQIQNQPIQRYSIDKPQIQQEIPQQQNKQQIQVQELLQQQQPQIESKNSLLQPQKQPTQNYESDQYEDYVEVNEFGIADQYE